MPSTIRHTRVTTHAVDSMKANEVLRDTDLVGFGVRRRTGRPSYFFQKRIGARIRWITIGKHGCPWLPETARREAYRLMGQVASGDEPRLKRDDLSAAPTLRDLADRFLAEHGATLKPSTLLKYRFLLERYVLPELGDRLVARLGRPDVMRFHAGMARKKSLGNYSLAVLSKLMSWAEEQEVRPLQSNPCFKIKKFKEGKRQRYLSREEYVRLGKVLAHTEYINQENFYIVAALRLLLLTGARSGEIRSLKWRYVDLERGLLLLPDSKTGQKTIRLNPQALAILSDLPRVPGNEHVIAGRRQGAHLVNLAKPWRRIRKEAGLDDVCVHDLRHSFASVGAAARGSLPMIGRLLGHNHQMTTARYAHLAADPVDDLNATIGATIAEAIGLPAQRSSPNAS